MPAFIRFLSVSISGKIQAASTVQARSELLIQQLVKYKSLNSFSGGYLVSGNSVKETMISYLETQLTVLAAQPSGHMMAEYKFTKLHTALSVPQLAFFTRLLVETKVLNEASQSALLKNLAAFVSTSKAPSISPESLRINYYTPNNATKNIIKEYLLQMIRLVNTY